MSPPLQLRVLRVGSRPWTRLRGKRMRVDVDQPEPGWRPGDRILVDLPDGQTARCRVVNVKDNGTVQVVPEHAVVIGTA